MHDSPYLLTLPGARQTTTTYRPRVSNDLSRRKYVLISRDRVAQAVAEQVEPENGHEEQDAGEERRPPPRRQEVARRRDHEPPLRHRRPRAEPEESERPHGEDGQPELEGGLHDDDPRAVRQDVAKDDP